MNDKLAGLFDGNRFKTTYRLGSDTIQLREVLEIPSERRNVSTWNSNAMELMFKILVREELILLCQEWKASRVQESFCR